MLIIILALICTFASGVCAGMAWLIAHPGQIEKWERKDREFVESEKRT